MPAEKKFLLLLYFCCGLWLIAGGDDAPNRIEPQNFAQFLPQPPPFFVTYNAVPIGELKITMLCISNSVINDNRVIVTIMDRHASVMAFGC